MVTFRYLYYMHLLIKEKRSKNFYLNATMGICQIKAVVLLHVLNLSVCVQTGEALNIDPREFYSMLYLSLLQVHVGKARAKFLGIIMYIQVPDLKVLKRGLGVKK